MSGVFFLLFLQGFKKNIRVCLDNYICHIFSNISKSAYLKRGEAFRANVSSMNVCVFKCAGVVLAMKGLFIWCVSINKRPFQLAIFLFFRVNDDYSWDLDRRSVQ